MLWPRLPHLHLHGSCAPDTLPRRVTHEIPKALSFEPYIVPHRALVSKLKDLLPQARTPLLKCPAQLVLNRLGRRCLILSPEAGLCNASFADANKNGTKQLENPLPSSRDLHTRCQGASKTSNWFTRKMESTSSSVQLSLCPSCFSSA